MALDNCRQQVLLAWEEMAGTANVESALANATYRTENAVALGAANCYTVPAGKTLRIANVACYAKATSTVNNLARFRIRQAAAVANNSPLVFDVVFALELASTAASASEANNYAVEIDVTGGQQIAFTWLTAANTCTVGMSITGYLM